MHIEAAGGLIVSITPAADPGADVGDSGSIRIGWGETDWFGPGRLSSGTTSLGVSDGEVTTVCDDIGAARSLVVHDGDVIASVRAYRDVAIIVFRLEAARDLVDLDTGSYDAPALGWPVFTPGERAPGGVDPGSSALAFQACEFGFPSGAGIALDRFFLLPHRPPTGWPLLLTASDGRTLMAAPLDNFHDQTIGLNGGTVRCGWHGDLESVPAGFATELAVIAAADARTCIDMWGALLCRRAATVRPGRWPDALGSSPSYWTDNGAAYWYRTEPGLDAADSIVAAVDDLRAQGVPIGSVQLDSWWYPHADLRPFNTDEWIVPPSAMIAWEPRPDVLPDGIESLRARLGSPPLVAHIRHLSSSAPIAEVVPVHVDGAYAAPATSEAYERWLDQCIA